MKKLIYLLVILFSIINISCENEPVGESILQNTITTDSELFFLLKRVTEQKNDPMQDIVCIDFIYPFKVLIYNTNREIIGYEVVSGDADFSTFLGNLPTDQSISISYPLSTTLKDGTVFSVNSNAELKIAIDSCSREDIIAYCNGLFGGCNCSDEICVWKVPYTKLGDNKYASSVFESNNNVTLRLTYNDIVYTGTWVFLFVDDKLHININFEGNSQTVQYWNIDSEIELGINEIIIKNGEKNIILRKSCQTSLIYEVGETGPAGGLVFYDKGSYSNGWRFVEAAPTDSNASEWGCFGSEIANASSSEIGTGLLNSISVTNFHDNLQAYYTNPSVCNALNNGSVGAEKTLMFEINNKKDWLLPSENELSLMYENLKAENLGSFTNSNYWSSTQQDANNASGIDFANGLPISISKNNTLKVRAIRYF